MFPSIVQSRDSLKKKRYPCFCPQHVQASEEAEKGPNSVQTVMAIMGMRTPTHHCQPGQTEGTE